MTRPDTTHRLHDRRLRPMAALLAWVLPGLGHVYLGQRRRGARVAAGMSLLILGGLFLGGVDAVDSQRDQLWFLAQVPCGPIIILADVVNQRVAKAGTELEQVSWASLNNVNAIAILYIALAGLMNVFVILDALYASVHKDRPRRRAQDAPT